MNGVCDGCLLTLTFRSFESMLKCIVAKRRIDTLLVVRGLVESREKARVMVMEGAVVADNRTVVKPSTLVDEDAEVEILESPQFVSRGGVKLDYALDQFQVDVNGLVAVDVGASTGGFTDCLLKRGARKVYAVDVGYGQLDYKLRQDPKVVAMERVNARYAFTLPESVDVATVDVSFISLEKVVPTVAKLVKAKGQLIAWSSLNLRQVRGRWARAVWSKTPLFMPVFWGALSAGLWSTASDWAAW